MFCKLSPAGSGIIAYIYSWLREDCPLVRHGPSIILNALIFPDSSAVIEDVAVLCDADFASMAYF